MGKNSFLGVLKSAFWHHGVLPFLWAVRALNVKWVKVPIRLMITVLMDYGTEVIKINMLLAFIHQKDMSQNFDWVWIEAKCSPKREGKNIWLKLAVSKLCVLSTLESQWLECKPCLLWCCLMLSVLIFDAPDLLVHCHLWNQLYVILTTLVRIPFKSRCNTFFQVINFEMPQSAPGYVHRIGRTGRAYNTGASVSLVSCVNKW